MPTFSKKPTFNKNKKPTLTEERTMPTVKQVAKSKSNEFNIVVAPAIIMVLKSCGIEVPVEVILAFYAIVNFFLRFFTKKPLAEK